MVNVDMDSFDPLEASLGGVLIGIAAVILLVFVGRIAGISGALGGIFTWPLKKDHLWRAAFIISLVAGGVIMHFALSMTIDPEKLGFNSWYSVAGGALLVGTGTRMGNGCTSGHGVCGLSRLSFRSIVGTCTFMTAGVAAAWILPWIHDWIHIIIAAVLALSVFGLKAFLKFKEIRATKSETAALSKSHISVASSVEGMSDEGENSNQETKHNQGTQDVENQSENDEPLPWYRKFPILDISAAVVSGLIFGLGLSLSGMTQPKKVTSFLRLFSEEWDPSLALVMGAAVLVGVVSFTIILPPKFLNPVFASILKEPMGYHAKLPLFNSSQWYVPGPNGQVDWQLMLGTTVFGLGWGMAGMCPGPALIIGMVTAKGDRKSVV